MAAVRDSLLDFNRKHENGHDCKRINKGDGGNAPPPFCQHFKEKINGEKRENSNDADNPKVQIFIRQLQSKRVGNGNEYIVNVIDRFGEK